MTNDFLLLLYHQIGDKDVAFSDGEFRFHHHAALGAFLHFRAFDLLLLELDHFSLADECVAAHDLEMRVVQYLALFHLAADDLLLLLLAEETQYGELADLFDDFDVRSAL